MADELSVTDRLLAMILVQQMGEGSQTEKAIALSSAGITNQHIAELLGTSVGSVTQQLYVARRGKGPKGPRSRKRGKRGSR
jgi:hypothetical protein